MMFGHCQYAGSDLNKHNCPGRYQRFYFGPVKKGRKTEIGLIMLDEYRECDCLCHTPEEDRPKKPKKTTAPRRRRRKT